MLAREAEHRTKNVLQAVQTVVHLSQARTAEELKEVIEGRIQALANAHVLLAQSRWVDADLANLVRQELAPYLQSERPRARIDGPHVPVQSSVAQAIAMLLHELTTNAANTVRYRKSMDILKSGGCVCPTIDCASPGSKPVARYHPAEPPWLRDACNGNVDKAGSRWGTTFRLAARRTRLRNRASNLTVGVHRRTHHSSRGGD